MDRTAFYAALRKRNSGLFGTSLSKSQVEGINGILDAFETHGDGNPKTLAYALATAYHETGRRMVPVREGFATTDAGARRAVNNLAKERGPNSAVAKYAQPAGPYGHVYYGRGRIQETWIDNYRESSADAGVDLVKYPDKHLDPVIDAKIMIRGLIDGRWNGRRKGIGYYLPKNGPDDIENARRTVNVTDKWETIGGYYKSFLSAVKAASGAAKAETKQDAPVPADPTPQDSILKRGSKGPYVRELQTSLKALGYAVTVDGDFGPGTETAVRAFQKANGLKSDGWAGPRTIDAVGRALGEKKAAPKIEKAAEETKDKAKQEVEKKTSLWQWITGTFFSGGLGIGWLGGMDWQTVAVLGGVVIVFLVILLVLRQQIIGAVKDIKGAVEGDL